MALNSKTAVYKDPVTAELALGAHFFTAQLAKKIFLQVQNPQACRSLLENMIRPAKDLRMRIRKNTSFDLLLCYQASSYCSIRCSVRRSTNNGLLYQAEAASVGLGCMHLLLSPCRLASTPLAYRRHHCFRTHVRGRCTFVRSQLLARASALTQAQDARAYAHDCTRAARALGA